MDDAEEAADSFSYALTHDHITAVLDYQGDRIHYVADVVRHGDAILSVDVESDLARWPEQGDQQRVLTHIVRHALGLLALRLTGHSLLATMFELELN